MLVCTVVSSFLSRGAHRCSPSILFFCVNLVQWEFFPFSGEPCILLLTGLGIQYHPLLHACPAWDRYFRCLVSFDRYVACWGLVLFYRLKSYMWRTKKSSWFGHGVLLLLSLEIQIFDRKEAGQQMKASLCLLLRGRAMGRDLDRTVYFT